MARTYARSDEGERAYSKHPGSRGGNISLIGAIRLEENPILYPFDGAVNEERFLYYLDILKPNLKHGDVVIMDNCRIHKGEAIKDSLKAVGSRPLFLPPYSPELNPIEETWSEIKGVFRSKEARTISDYIDVMDTAKLSITPKKIEAYFRHADSFLNHHAGDQSK